MTPLMTLNQPKMETYIIIASLKSATMSKLINIIQGTCLLISSLPEGLDGGGVSGIHYSLKI